MSISIRTMLIIGFFSIFIAMAFVGWRGIVGMRDINEELNPIMREQFEATSMIAEANTALLAWNRALLNHVIAEAGPEMDKYEQIMLDQKSILIERFHLLSNTKRLSKKGKELIQRLGSSFKFADRAGNRAIALSGGLKQDEARVLIQTELRPLVDSIDRDMTEFIRLQKGQLEDVMRATDKRYVEGFRRISSTMVVAFFVSFIICFFLWHQISKGVNEMVRGARLIETEDFKHAKLHITSKDEFGYLASVFNHMLDSLERGIADREKKEEALRRSEEKYRTLVEDSLTGIYVEQDKKIRFANSRFAEIYRYTEEELLGIEAGRLVHPEDRALEKETGAKRLSGEDVPIEYEVRGLTNDGEAIWLQRRSTLIEYEAKPAILGNIVDITEQKRAEEELKRKNEELEKFVHMVSHDLKNPILSIQGLSTLALKKYDKKLWEKGRRSPSFVQIPSSEIVDGVMSGLQGRLRVNRTGINVGKDFPTICCDGGEIYQVFENLIVNALKSTRDRKKQRIEIGYEDAGEFHQFFVQDNGIGIDKKHHKRIFGMFERLNKIEDEEGTGLGLAIVQRIVDNHGGKVWVESEEGKGATFLFTLPKHPSSSSDIL